MPRKQTTRKRTTKRKMSLLQHMDKWLSEHQGLVLLLVVLAIFFAGLMVSRHETITVVQEDIQIAGPADITQVTGPQITQEQCVNIGIVLGLTAMVLNGTFCEDPLVSAVAMTALISILKLPPTILEESPDGFNTVIEEDGQIYSVNVQRVSVSYFKVIVFLMAPILLSDFFDNGDGSYTYRAPSMFAILAILLGFTDLFSPANPTYIGSEFPEEGVVISGTIGGRTGLWLITMVYGAFSHFADLVFTPILQNGWELDTGTQPAPEREAPYFESFDVIREDRYRGLTEEQLNRIETEERINQAAQDLGLSEGNGNEGGGR